MEKYAGNMKEYDEICGKYEGIPPTVGTLENLKISPSI